MKMTKPTAQIFDMDGTLVNVDKLLHHVKGENKDFNAFHAGAIDAPYNPKVVAMVDRARENGHAIIVVTARKERWRAETSFWLAMHLVPSDALFMRSNRDNRPDYEVKAGILHRIRQYWDVVHATDDNPAVIKLWESEGIPTTKIGNWNA
jgi:phosphoglycolate phosphatase-like HAD superfamily hydrolase